MENPGSNNLKPKTHVLFIGILLMIINFGVNFLVPESSGYAQVINILFAIKFNILTLLWCTSDSRGRGQQPGGRYFTLGVIVFGIFALFYYLFKTRGFRLGAIAIAKFIAICFATFIVSSIIFAILDSFFGAVAK